MSNLEPIFILGHVDNVKTNVLIGHLCIQFAAAQQFNLKNIKL